MKNELNYLAKHYNAQLLLCEAKIEAMKKAFSQICTENGHPDFEARYTRCLLNSFDHLGVDSLKTLPPHIAKKFEELQSLLRDQHPTSDSNVPDLS